MKFLFIGILLLVPLGIFVFRPRLTTKYTGNFHGVKADAIIAPIVTLAVFLCSFMGFQTTAAFQKARLVTTNEGAAVQQFYETASLLPSNTGRELQATSVCYARSIEHLDWPATARFTSSEVTDTWSLRLSHELGKTVDGPSPIVSRLLTLEGSQTDTRFVRLSDAEVSLPWVMVLLVVLAVVASVFLVSTFALTEMRRAMALTLAGVLGFLLASSLIVVEQLDEPYSGFISIKPTAMRKVERSISEQFTLTYPDIGLPCDGEGNPI